LKLRLPERHWSNNKARSADEILHQAQQQQEKLDSDNTRLESRVQRYSVYLTPKTSAKHSEK